MAGFSDVGSTPTVSTIWPLAVFGRGLFLLGDNRICKRLPTDHTDRHGFFHFCIRYIRIIRTPKKPFVLCSIIEYNKRQVEKVLRGGTPLLRSIKTTVPE
ncbi:hypothetical protein JXQ31_12440 [candidate division KSB1 bacterium]|nr:hypothetical protein [candidate division KSB1 bacterium]